MHPILTSHVHAGDLLPGHSLPAGAGDVLVVEDVDVEGELVALRFAGSSAGRVLRRFDRVLVLEEAGR